MSHHFNSIGTNSATVSNIDLDPTVELEQTNLNPAHLEEWVQGSGVHPGIVELNVQSLTHQEDIFAFLYPNARRLNSGKLCTQDLKRFENCADSSGWVVTGISPETWERETSWGRMKFDPGSLAASCDYDGKTAKYKSPAAGKGSSKIILLDVPHSIWEAVAQKYNVEIDDDNFWRWVAEHPEIPIYITEGEKKAGSILSQGFVAIGLPGCWGGTVKRQGGHVLHPYLEPFMDVDRVIYLVPDSDPQQETRDYVNKAFMCLGKAMGNRVMAVKIAELPGENEKMGADDYLVGGGSIEALRDRAILIQQWQKQLQNAQSGIFLDYFCEKYENRLLYIGELSTWYAYQKGKNPKPGVWGQVSENSVRAVVQQEMKYQAEKLTATAVSNAMKLCQFDERIFRHDFPEMPATWTPFSNCILNRETKQVIPHAPENFLLWSLPRKYNPSADDWSGIYNWLMFKNGGDETLTEIDIAYCFAVLNLDVAGLQRTYLGIGEPGAGKGTMQLLWEKLVGEENILSTTLDRWCNNRFEPARAWGKRLILFDDADKVKGDLQTYKSVTGGSRIPYELKGKNTQQANFLFTGMIGTFANYDPFTLKRDDASALARRHIPMPYNHPIPIGQQRDMGAIFEKYLDGFINHLLQWNESDVEKILKGSHNNANVRSMKWEQRYDSDFVFAAINDLFIFDTTASIEVGAKSYDPYAKSHKKAYPAVLNYLEEHGYWSGKGKPPVSGNHFSRKVVAIAKEMGYKVTAQKSGHKNTSCLFGLRLRQSQDPELTFLEALENQNSEVKSQNAEIESPNAEEIAEVANPYREIDAEVAEVKTEKSQSSSEEKNIFSAESQSCETQASDPSWEEKNNFSTESQSCETPTQESAWTSSNSTFDSGSINPETPSPEEKIPDAATGANIQSDSTSATSALPAQQGVTDSASMSAVEKTTSANSGSTSASVSIEDLKLHDIVFDQQGRMHQLVEKFPTHWKTNQNHDVSRSDWQQGKYHSPTVDDVANLINRIESVKQLKWVVNNLNELMQMAISQNLISSQKLEAIYSLEE